MDGKALLRLVFRLVGYSVLAFVLAFGLTVVIPAEDNSLGFPRLLYIAWAVLAAIDVIICFGTAGKPEAWLRLVVYAVVFALMVWFYKDIIAAMERCHYIYDAYVWAAKAFHGTS